MKRTGMTDIKDILSHRHVLGVPRAQIAVAMGVNTGPLQGRVHNIGAFGSMRQHAGGFAVLPICRTGCNDGQLRSTNPLLWARAGGGNVLSKPVWTSGRSCLWVPSRVREE